MFFWFCVFYHNVVAVSDKHERNCCTRLFAIRLPRQQMRNHITARVKINNLKPTVRRQDAVRITTPSNGICFARDLISRRGQSENLTQPNLTLAGSDGTRTANARIPAPVPEPATNISRFVCSSLLCACRFKTTKLAEEPRCRKMRLDRLFHYYCCRKIDIQTRNALFCVHFFTACLTRIDQKERRKK